MGAENGHVRLGIYAGRTCAIWRYHRHDSGLSMVFADWRFKLQVSDPLSVCLCVESRGDSQLMQVKTAELLANISGTEERP